MFLSYIFSYSRQNLLSGSVKTMTDTTSGPIANSASGNAISSVNTSLMYVIIKIIYSKFIKVKCIL